jgi:hypothetical protein
MSYYIWTGLNGLFFLTSLLYIWFFRPHDSILITSGQFFAQVAIWIFIINVNMYFIFLVIKRVNKREIKISLAKLSRKLMKAHIPMAIIGTSLILLHAGIMLATLGSKVGYGSPKMISGYTAIFMLSLTLFGGYRRHKRASGFRRKFHLVMALIFGAIFIIHLFLPIHLSV